VTRIVVDASVAIKWLLPDRAGEADSDRALALLSGVREGTVDLIQPPHWLAEVAAVLVRLSPQTVEDDVSDLYALEIPVLDTPGMYLTACELARSLGHHLFDTLYHAAALEVEATSLVTADEHYYRKASARGSIVLLSDFSAPARGTHEPEGG
jgi:predicted nucleic acid-binding protein